MSSLSMLQAASNFIKMPLASSSEDSLTSPIPNEHAALPIKQGTSSVHLEQKKSEVTSSTELDSGYVSTTNSRQVSGILTDGVLLPGWTLFPRKVTILKEFSNFLIAQSVQSRFKDLSELYSKPLYRFINKETKTGVGNSSLKLKVLGETVETARPWVVVFCEKNVKRSAYRFFRQRKIRDAYEPPKTDVALPSFKIIICDVPPTLRAKANLTDIYTHAVGNAADSATLCGMIIKANQPDGDRIATIGGLLKVIGVDAQVALYGMTAGHVFRDQVSTLAESEYLDFDIEEYSESEHSYYSEDEGFELDSAFDDDDAHAVHGASIFPKASTEEEENVNESWRKIGHISLTSQDTDDEKNLDWALIDFEDSFLYKPNLLFDQELKMNCDNPNIVSDSTTDQKVILLSGISGIKHGILSMVPSFLLMSPGTNFIMTYNLRLSDGSGMIL